MSGDVATGDVVNLNVQLMHRILSGAHSLKQLVIGREAFAPHSLLESVR